MHRRAALISLLFLVFAGGVAAQSGPQNLDFEQGQNGSIPAAWRLTTKGYSAQLTDKGAKVGSYCGELARNMQAEADSFGNLMQSFDTTPYRGKRVRFRAAVRAELPAEADRAALWLRVDRPQGGMGFFDNMMDRPIRTNEWRYYEIVGDIDNDATSINVGLMLLKTGKVWIDDASFEVLGDAPKPTIEAARLLTPRGLSNLTAFARLYGYVRYFHPSDQSANTDWDSFVINGVRQIEGAANDIELAQKLEALFKPIAPTLTVVAKGTAYNLAPELLPTMDAANRKITYWEHHGVGLNAGDPRSPYHSERVQHEAISTVDNTPLPEKPWRADLGGVTAWVPLAVYVDSQGTLPHLSSTAQPSPSVRPSHSVEDRATRLADVIIAWNVFQHFYPYFDVVKTDWHSTLINSLESAAIDANEAAFTLTLRRLVHDLHDGHGGVYHNSAGLRSLPLQWDWIESQLVVTAVGNSVKERLAPGDAVISINGQPVREAITAAEALVSGATPQWTRYRALQELAQSWTGAVSTDLVIQPFRTPDKNVKVTVPFEPAMPNSVQEPRPAKVAELEPGIFYVDPTRLSNEEFALFIPQLEGARGIIFEFRGYPRIWPAFLTHLSDHALVSAQWNVPIVLFPDRHNISFERGGEWNLAPTAPLFKGKIAFITDGRAISYAESCMGIVEHYKLGAIVGGPTAGTNGNVNRLALPGGYSISWTGMKVLKQDGSRHHGVGIAPTPYVMRTRAAVAAGRDEFLQAAMDAVRN
jgi:hypothetical protein